MAPTSLFHQLVFLAASFLLISGENDLLKVVEECSKHGREVGEAKKNCGDLEKSVLPHQEKKQTCLAAAQLACSYLIREWRCGMAAEKSRNTGECNGFQSEEEMECCTACLLGKEVGISGAGCLSTNFFGTLLEGTFATCCQQSFPDLPDTTTGGTRNVCEELAGELCSHICLPTQDSYRCVCRPGFQLMSDGKSCTPEISGCDGCSHGCKERKDGLIICTCPPPLLLGPDNLTCVQPERKRTCPGGYRLKRNETNLCEDIDECKEGSSNCDLTRQRCLNTIGSFSCVPLTPEVNCKPGYQYIPASGNCEDVNECLESGDDPPCDSNQICENTPGSFVCKCKTGFRRDPVTLACIDINECQLNLHKCASFQRCDNTIGSFVCVRDISCGTGYTLNHQSGNCEDDDECELGTDTCRVLGPEYECQNRVGSFRCVRKVTSCSSDKCGGGPVGPCFGDHCPHTQPTCPAGYVWNSHTCEDIDECEKGLARCGPNQRCVNIKGNYLCSDIVKCKPGFKLNSAKTQCTDINECEEREYEGICSHFCENRWGSYRCHCRSGYMLHSDNRTCLDVNECEHRVRRCQGYCINQPGSYSCGCPPGYRIGANKHTCEDINECETTPGICQEQNEICINIAGSYRCNSFMCPPGYHKDGSRRRRCVRNNLACRIDDIECKKQPASYTYDYITLVSNYTIPRSGSIKLFTIESRWGSSAPDFKLELIQARVPPGTQAATREVFNLNKEYGRATIELVSPLFGPQDIQLELKTEFSNNNVFLGVSVFNIDIFVSQYTF